MMSQYRAAKVARIWRGRVRRSQADEYEAYNYQVGVAPLKALAVGVVTLREDRDSYSEFVTISYWESVAEMQAFTGGDPTEIHHLPRDAEFLIEPPPSLQILEIRNAHGQGPAPTGAVS